MLCASVPEWPPNVGVCETADVSERDRPSGYLTEGLEASPEAARQLNQHGYLYALLGLVAVVVIGVALLLWLA